ncbi:polyketide synthase, partial [Mycobacterium simiae]
MGYWVEHVRKPVRFADGVAQAEALGATTFVEVGPHAGLAGAVPLLAKNRPEAQFLLTGLGRLFTDGVAINWQHVFNGLAAHRVELPTYAFTRQRYWL